MSRFYDFEAEDAMCAMQNMASPLNSFPKLM